MALGGCAAKSPWLSAGNRVVKIKTSTKAALVQHLEWENKAQRLHSILSNFSIYSIRLHGGKKNQKNTKKPNQPKPWDQNKPAVALTELTRTQAGLMEQLVENLVFPHLCPQCYCSSQALQITPSHSQQHRTPRHFSVHSVLTQIWLRLMGTTVIFFIIILSGKLTSVKSSASKIQSVIFDDGALFPSVLSTGAFESKNHHFSRIWKWNKSINLISSPGLPVHKRIFCKEPWCFNYMMFQHDAAREIEAIHLIRKELEVSNLV